MGRAGREGQDRVMARGSGRRSPTVVLGASGHTGRALVMELAGRRGHGGHRECPPPVGTPRQRGAPGAFRGRGASVVECPLLEAGPAPPPARSTSARRRTSSSSTAPPEGARDEGIAGDPYVEVDLGLTRLALAAAAAVEPAPRVLSPQGTGAGARGAYLRARHACEAVRGSGLPFTIARAP